MVNINDEQGYYTPYKQQQQEYRNGGPAPSGAALGRSRNVGGTRRRPAARVRGTNTGTPGQVTAAGRNAITNAQMRQRVTPKGRRR